MAGCIVAAIVLILAMALSWALTCGILYLISLCFSLAFSWSIATGIWLVLFLLSSFFRSSNSSSKK